MPIDTVGAAAAGAGSPTAIGLQDFLRILLTQLNYQDPLKPMDNQQFMAQMAQFTSLEQSQRLNEQLGRLVANQAALQSVGLIGRSVDVVSGPDLVSGVVASLSLRGDAPVVSITAAGGRQLDDIPLSRLAAIR